MHLPHRRHSLLKILLELDPRKPLPLPLPDTVTDSAVFDYFTWDVAVATESLAYIDPEVVAMISDAQRMIEKPFALTRYSLKT